MSQHANIERNIPTPVKLKVWYIGIFLCMTGLYFLGVISKDNSADAYILLGTIAMLIPSVIDIVKEIKRYNEFKRKRDEREQKAAEQDADKVNE